MAKILAIDDDPWMIQLLQRLATAGGYTFIEARNGKEGLLKAAEEMPDLIICDIIMPHMDGLEAIKRMRHDIELNHIPVIVITARPEEKILYETMGLGVSYFFAKPVASERLANKIEELLGAKRTSDNG